jgi:CheY-like chemotaxis protein
VQELAEAGRVLDLVSFGFPGVVVTDIRMPGMDGLTLMNRIHDIDRDIPVILVTGHGDVQLAVRAMREGAYDFVEKPFPASHWPRSSHARPTTAGWCSRTGSCARRRGRPTTSRRGWWAGRPR